MFNSNITFRKDPIAELFGEVDRILEAERVRILRARQSHCCYCAPQECSPELKLQTCQSCEAQYEQ